jgi:hypothetical protein
MRLFRRLGMDGKIMYVILQKEFEDDWIHLLQTEECTRLL